MKYLLSIIAIILSFSLFIFMTNAASIGDINSDGKVTSSDVSLVERHLLGIITFNSSQLTLSDINNDGKSNSTDISLIERFILGITNSLGTSSPTITPTNTIPTQTEITLINGTQFADTSGNPIHAHGGGLLKYNEYYYWYGEFRDSGYMFNGVRCYRSKDLKNWELRGEVLKPSSASELNSCNVERPKVIFNAQTKQFVMWMHWEDGVNYGKARAAVAYCNTPDGNFTYSGSFRPYQDSGVTDHNLPGYMSRDCNLFVDTDGSAYFISSSNENMDLHLYKLSSDYKSISTLVTKLFVGSQREAPCLFKRNNYYYLLTSGCTSWNPNQSKYAYSTSLSSGWSSLINIGDSTTFNSQSTYVLPIQGSEGTSYLYTGDRWAPAWGGKVNDSQYVWLPLVFNSDTSLSLTNSSSISINVSTGQIKGNAINTTYYKILNQGSQKIIDIDNQSTENGAVAQQWDDNNGANQIWSFIEYGPYKKIVNKKSQKVLDVNNQSKADNTPIIQYTDNGGANQQWEFVDVGNGYAKIVNKNSQKVLDVSSDKSANGSDLVQNTYTGASSQHWKLVIVK